MKVLLVHSKSDPVRLAFAHVFDKRPGMTNDNGSKSPDKFEATFILHPGGENDKKLQAAIAAVAKEKYGDNWADIYTEFGDDQKGRRKGNLKTMDDGSAYDGFADNFYVTAKNEARPGVFSLDNSHVAAGDDGAPYAGCYVHGEIDVWALNKKGFKKRIVSDLLGIRKAADGDAFSAGAPPSRADSFADLSVEDSGESEDGAAEAPASGGAFD
jgi:hypothetical protein